MGRWIMRGLPGALMIHLDHIRRRFSTHVVGRWASTVESLPPLNSHHTAIGLWALRAWWIISSGGLTVRAASDPGKTDRSSGAANGTRKLCPGFSPSTWALPRVDRVGHYARVAGHIGALGSWKLPSELLPERMRVGGGSSGSVPCAAAGFVIGERESAGA